MRKTSIIIGLLTLVYISLRISFYPFESDELQHLHVIYSWIKGFVQYRDVFDNHTPLFHITMAGIIQLLHLHPSTNFVVYARIIVFMLFFIPQILILGLFLGKSLNFSKDEIIFILSTLIVLIPNSDIAVRPAPLYTMLFLSCIYIISFCDIKKPRNIFILGLLNGVNASVSLKTIPLFLPAELTTILLIRKFYDRKIEVKKLFAYFTLGFVIVPTIICICFWKLNSLGTMIYYTITYNLLPIKNNYFKSLFYFLIITTPYVYFLRKYRGGINRAIFSLLSITNFTLALLVVYPERQSQTTMPVRLLICLCLLIGLTYILKLFLSKRTLRFTETSIFIVVLFLKSLNPLLFIDHNAKYKKSMKTLLTLAKKDDYVMDAKGESIFWKRPYYYGLEEFTSMRLKKGLLRDEIVQSLITHKTHIVFPFENAARFPTEDLRFIRKNYVPIIGTGWVLVSGKRISKNFTVRIPGNYIILNERFKPVNGILDGKAYRKGQKVNLSIGNHTFTSTNRKGRNFIYWYRAYKKGILPNGI